MAEELPCPECDGWMRLDGKQWACPACGHRSEELEEGEPELVAEEPPAADLAVAQGVATSSPSYRGPAKGRRRSFGVSLLLGIVTLGLYFLYWQWRVFREVHDQERSRSWSGFMWAAYAMGFVRLVWRLSRGRDPDGFGLADGGLPDDLLALAQSALFLAYLLLEIRHLDRLLASRRAAGSEASGWMWAEGIIGAAASILPEPGNIIVGVLGIGVALMAYFRLQDGLNRYWSLVNVRPAPAPTGLTPVAS